MRERVGPWLARGIVAAAVLAAPGSVLDPAPPADIRADRALALVRSQDFSPVYTVAARRIDGHFREAREEEFLDEVFGLSGKWKAVTRGRRSYERFVRKSFERHLFRPDEFAEVLRKIRDDYAFAVDASQNRLLAVLYDDLRVRRPGLEWPSFRGEYDRLTGELAPCVLRDLGMNGISIMGSEAATVLLVAALTSAGILGGSTAVGASGGAWSFGAGLVAGIAVGAVIDGIVGGAWEEAAGMELRRHLNALRWQVLDAVGRALEEALEAHRKIQEECVLALYRGGGHDGSACRR